MKLSIRLCSTERYLHVWKHVVRSIVAAASHRKEVHIVYVSDQSEACKKAFELIKVKCPPHWIKEHITIALEDKGVAYKIEQQILIAKMHAEGFAAARLWGAEQCWTVEADVLPPPDALVVMEWALAMPQADGSPYYDVAFCTYPNKSFIGGFGEPNRHIAEDLLPKERVLPKELKARYDAHLKEEKALAEARKQPDEKWIEKAKALDEEIKKCPPGGSIWEMNAKHGWRRRGWMDSAYPGIGRGAIVPVDWCGEGCNLLSKKALSVANYDGYAGAGTQDLFLCWQRYHPAGIRIACITHSVCDHVKYREGKPPLHLRAYHEQQGENRGHLRVSEKDWTEI